MTLGAAGCEGTRGCGGFKSERRVKRGLKPVDDDDDYNNRAFRGFEITVHVSLV